MIDIIICGVRVQNQPKTVRGDGEAPDFLGLEVGLPLVGGAGGVDEDDVGFGGGGVGLEAGEVGELGGGLRRGGRPFG